MLSSPTCVGLRYGHLRQRTTLFLAACLEPLWVCLSAPPTVVFRPLNGVADLPTAPAYALQRTSVCARTLRFCVTPYVNAVRWYGNVDPFSIAYAFRPPLRSRLTLFRLTLNRNPEACGGCVSHTSYRYSCLHFLFQRLHRASQRGFGAAGMLFYRCSRAATRSFGAMLDAREFSMPDRSTSELLRTL